MTEHELEQIWDTIGEKVLNNVKVYLLTHYVSDILHHYNRRIDIVVNKYARYLPSYVAESEIDDLRTIAKLEFLETLKVWDPVRYEDAWPLAQTRIVGAMKDHIRYITKSDPSRFYEWVSDAAHMYLTINDRADFAHEIETGVELTRAMKCLSYRERKIVIAHTKHDLTFRQIGEKLGVSESQISRIYKKAIQKVKKELEKTT